MHNQISLDGAVSGFQIDPAQYYISLNKFGATMYLVDSDTVLSGIKSLSKKIPLEVSSDFQSPVAGKKEIVPWWVIPDSQGRLEGLLHVYRRYEHCRDVIILVTSKTPDSYISYLDSRNYTYILSGEVNVNFRNVFELLNQKVPFEIMITDNDGALSSILLENAMVDQISLILSPTLTGKNTPKLFRELSLGKRVIKLEPVNAEILQNRDILILYNVVK